MASKVRLRDVLKPGKTVIDYTYDLGDCWSTGSRSPMFVPVSRTSHIRATSAARETGRPRIAVEFRVSTNGWQQFQIPPMRTMRKPKNGRTITIQI